MSGDGQGDGCDSGHDGSDIGINWWTCAFTCGVFVLQSFVFWQLMDEMVQIWACGLTVSHISSYEQIRDRCVNPTRVFTELIATLK